MVDARNSDSIQRVAAWLQAADRVLFITGAGISADSGMPTYRGIGGLYNTDTTADGPPIESILSGQMLRQNPELTWKYLRQIADAARGVSCSRGHEVIAALEKRCHVVVLTQNVDGLHLVAGSTDVIEIHGNMRSLSCTECRGRIRVDSSMQIEMPPRCSACDGVMRPDVVLFGEMLPTEALDRLEAEVEQGFDLVFCIGTTAVFPYIQMPVLMAQESGVPTVEINPEGTLISEFCSVRIRMGAAAALEAIWQACQ